MLNWRMPCSHCSSVEYLLNRRIEMNPPGTASKPRTLPTPPMSASLAAVSPSKTEAAKCAMRRGNGRSRMDRSQDAACDFVGIDLLRQVKERIFERGHERARADLFNRAVRHHGATAQDEQVRTDFLDNFEDRRAENDRLALSG